MRYYIKDRLTGKQHTTFTSTHKQDLKGERDLLNAQFPWCCDKKQNRFVISGMK